MLQGTFVRFFLILFLIFFPSIVFSKIGDVYYCVGKNFVRVENFKVKQYKPENFTFKRTYDGLIFGSEENYLKDIDLKIRVHDFNSELFSYKNKLGGWFQYYKGIFHYTTTTYYSITGISGTCSIF